MALNVTTAVIGGGCQRAVSSPSLAQWDRGQILKITGVDLPQVYNVEFCCQGDLTTTTMLGGADGVEIPNLLLQRGLPIIAYLVLHEGQDDRETEYWITIYVKQRAMPPSVTPNPEQAGIIDQLVAALNEGVTDAENAAAQAEAQVAHYPQVIDGTWHVWNALTESWVDTEVPATGPAGRGITGVSQNEDYTLTLTFTDNTTWTTPTPVRGATGATPNLTIGTVTTGAAGSSAAASITGTAENPVLSLTIPQGLKGDPGNGDAIAQTFSASTAYPAGAYVIYNGSLYRFTAAHAAGAWTGTDAVAAVLGNDVSGLKGEINTIDTVLINEHIYNKTPSVSFLGNYTVNAYGVVTANASYNAYIIALNGLSTVFVDHMEVYGFYSDVPALNSTATDDTRHFNAVDASITVDNGVNYILGVNSVSSGNGVSATNPNATATIGETVNSLNTAEIDGYSKVSQKTMLGNGVLNYNAYVEMVGTTGYQITTNTGYKYYKVPVTAGQKIKIYGLYGANLYPAIFVDVNDDFVSNYPAAKATTIHYEEVSVTVPTNARYVLISGYINDEIQCYDTSKIVYVAQNRKVSLLKSSDDISISSDFDDEVMTITGQLHGSENNAFKLLRYTLDNALWKIANDDITPIYFNDSYRGAGHGDDRGYTIMFSSSHGLTESNIGEIWTDANNVEILICKIISTTAILVCLPKTNPASNESPFTLATLASPMSKSGTSLAFASATRGQFAPIANNVDVSVYVDGEKVTANGEYYGDYVDVVECYDLLYLPSMVAYLKANVGSNTNKSYYSDAITEKYCTVTNVYRFTERGAMTLISSIDWAKTVNLSFAGIIQSQTIGDYYALPLTSANMLTDFNDTTVDFTPTIWNDASIPPNRYYQYEDAAMSKGIVLGYNTEIGTGKASARSASDTAGFINGASGKLYPKIVSNVGNTDTMIQCIAYRVPLCAYPGDVPSVGWYYINDDVYLLINAQSTVDTYIPLPDAMIGRKITVIETDGSITLPCEVVLANGIKIKTTSYGSAILKLSNAV